MTRAFDLPAGSVLIVHGGVDMSDGPTALAALGRAACAGWESLGRGLDVLDAAVAAVAVLEDDPTFNAGLGSVLTRDGGVETDAAVADGARGFAAVGAVPGIRHPALLARHLVAERGTGLLVGDGALRFAATVGIDGEDLATEEQRRALRDSTTGVEGRWSPFTGRRIPTETVGCIIIDAHDHVVAVSSTGGLQGKRSGRVGDAAILGAGIWADESCGVLCSGAGEAALRSMLAFQVAARVGDSDAAQAVEWGVKEVTVDDTTISAVLAVDAAHRTVAAAHSGVSFPVVVLDRTGTWVVEPTRVAGEVRR